MRDAILLKVHISQNCDIFSFFLFAQNIDRLFPVKCSDQHVLELSVSFDWLNCDDVTAGMAVTGTCECFFMLTIVSEVETMPTLVVAPDKEV